MMRSTRPEWTPAELQKLRDLHAANTSPLQISYILGRSIIGIKLKLHRLGANKPQPEDAPKRIDPRHITAAGMIRDGNSVAYVARKLRLDEAVVRKIAIEQHRRGRVAL